MKVRAGNLAITNPFKLSLPVFISVILKELNSVEGNRERSFSNRLPLRTTESR